MGTEFQRLLRGGIRRAVRFLGHVHDRLGSSGANAAIATASDGTEPFLVSEYWNTQFEVMRTDNSYWMNNVLVKEATYRLMTDQPAHWLNWLMATYFKDRVFDRSLSVCCGDGAHEIQLHKSGQVRCVTGFDISEGAVRQAQLRFEQAGAPTDRYRFDVADVNRLSLDGFYDLIFSTGALHHTTNLEALLPTLRAHLSPIGYFVVVEFVGPNRFQWTERQLEVINMILESIDPQYLRNGRRAQCERPTIERMLKTDPSEAVRSEEVYGMIRSQFDVLYERAYNGTIMHMLHPLLRSEFVNQGRRDFDSITRLILLLEDLLIQHGALPSDFVFMICRNPGADSKEIR